MFKLYDNDTSINLSLKEKLKESREEYKKRNVTPQMLNVFGILCSFYFLAIWPLINLYILFDYYSSSKLLWYRIFAIVFILFEIVLNYFKCFKVHKDIVFCSRCFSNGISQDAPEVPKQFIGYELCNKWRFCISCQKSVPPRSYHCEVCQVCILRANHHCYLTGRCVGYTTQRRFIVLCFYSVIGCLYTTWSIAGFLSKYYFSFDLLSFNTLNYILPIPIITGLFSSRITILFLFFLTNAYVAFFLTLFAMFNLVLHSILTFTGQTSHEGFNLIRRYQRDHNFNIETVFGKYFFIHFLWPFETEIAGNGYHWPLNQLSSGH